MNIKWIASCIAIQLALWAEPSPQKGAGAEKPAGQQEEPPHAGSATKAEEKLKDRPLTLVRQIRPQYPDAARKDLLAGPVQLEAVIDEEGSVESVRTLTGNPILAEAAASAVRRWVYQSAVVDGKAVKSTTVVKLNFRPPETQ